MFEFRMVASRSRVSPHLDRRESKRDLPDIVLCRKLAVARYDRVLEKPGCGFCYDT